MREMIYCVALDGSKPVQIEAGETVGTIPYGVKGYIAFDPKKCIEVTLYPDGRKTIKMPDNPKDAESAKLALEQGMGYVLSRFAGRPVEVTFDTEQGMVAKSNIRGEEAFLNLGETANSLKEAEQSRDVERKEIITKIGCISFREED